MARRTSRTAVRAAALFGAALTAATVAATPAAATPAATPAAATPAATPAAAPAGSLTCRYVVTNTWRGGFSADLYLTNAGPTVNGWTVRWTFDTPTSRILSWMATITQQDSVATATNMPYNAVIQTGQTVVFGWNATAASTTVPSDITVNGVRC